MASKKYIKDYELVETEDEQGRIKKSVIYHGDYFTLAQDESQIKRNKLLFIVLALAIVILQVAAGFVGNPGMYKFYAAVPYTSAFLPLIFMIMATFRLPSEKRPYRKEEIGLSFERIKTTSILFLVFMGIGWLGSLIFLLVTRGEGGLTKEILYLVLTGISLALAWIIYKKVNKIEISTSEDQGLT